MARSELMNLIRSWVRDRQEAEAKGLPVSAIREERERAAEERERRGIGRRQFLVGAAAATGAMMLPKRVYAGNAPRVAVVGGGISGMAAALTLADAGIAATVYESSGRIGGRMFSNASGYWTDNQVSEWCGELIDTSFVTIQGLAKRFGLTIEDESAAHPRGSTETYYFGGKYYTALQAEVDFDPVYKKLQDDRRFASYPTTFSISTAEGRALDNMSVYDWIESRVAGGHASPMGQLLDVAYVIEYGVDTRDQSALNLVYLLGYQPNSKRLALYGKSDERWHIRGGNQQLPVAIANALGAAVQTSMRLVAIASNADGTSTLTFRNGATTKTVIADLVILTVPFAAMSGVDYTKAGFDTLKQTAITQLGKGKNGKLQLQFTSRLWNQQGPWGVSNSSTYGDTGFQLCWEPSRGQPGNSGIFNNYTGGAPTVGMSTKTAYAVIDSNPAVRTDAQRFLGQIEPVFPGLTPLWNGKATSSLPHLDPNFACSYSYWRVGQYQRFAGYERVRQGNIFFAGEHCSQDFQGFMEGGAAEGVRAAKEVLDAIGARK